MASSLENIKKHYVALAEKYKLDFISLKSIHVEPNILDENKISNYLKLQAIPIEKTKNIIKIATSNPTVDNCERINEFFSDNDKLNLEIVITSRQDISSTLASRFTAKFKHDITHKRFDIDPIHSASYTFSMAEKVIIIFVLLIIIGGFVWDAYIAGFIVALVLSIGTIIVMAHKMGLTIRLMRWPQEPHKDIIIKDIHLPTYTVLIPLLREKEVIISALIKSLNQLDYPKNKLDIKLILEEDDAETLGIINQMNLPWYYDVIVSPPGLPRSKRRACNYGLYLAYGEFLTIYDAEDRPDSDQLKQALNRFKETEIIFNNDKTVCVQAALNFYNYRENLLTRLFAIEYTQWFDSYVPALVFLKAPVPLGGTSNHFKTHILLELGGWDPYIGTEDADIGMRIYRHNYNTNCITSTTYEEANIKWINWFKQRTRWNKGYMQTYFVNMRDPINMIKEVGFARFINFQYFVGGNVFIQLSNLPLWLFLIGTYFHFINVGLTPYLRILFFLTFFNFLIGNVILLCSEFYAVYRRGMYNLLPYVPLKLIYWLIMNFAGYYAIIELLVRPGYWYKTEHGFESPDILGDKH